MRKPDKRSVRILVISMSLCFYILLLFALTHLEKADPGSSIENFSDAVWYSIVTLTTVGYGDLYPVTPGGKLIGYLFVISSLGFLGFLISSLTNFFITFRERKKMGLFGTKFKNHIIIVGWDEFARGIVDQLINAGNRVAVITDNKNSLELIRESYDEKTVFTLFSDINNIENMSKASIKDASLVFINLKDDTEKLVYMLNLKKYYGELKFVITLNNPSLKDTFHSAGVDYVLSNNEVASKLVASYIFEPDVAQYSADLLSSSRGEEDFDLQQYRVIPMNPFCGKTYGEAFFSIKKDYDSILIGLSRQLENGERELLKNPPDDTLVGEGDYLIVITNGTSEKLLKEAFGTKEGVLNP